MEKTYSTTEAAKKIGVSPLTLHRWIKAGKIRPQGIPVTGRTIWIWRETDIAKARKVSQKPGPKPKGAKR